MNNDKKILITPALHQLLAAAPPEPGEFGLWVIQGSIGNIAPKGGFQKRQLRRFQFFCLSHMYAGGGHLRIGEEFFDLTPGDAVLICPDDLHLYGGTDTQPYCEDTVCFCGRIPELLRRCGVLCSRRLHLGAQRRLVPIVEKARSPEPSAWLSASLDLLFLLREVLLSGSGDVPADNDPMGMVLDKVKSSPPGHWWSVSEMAELRGLSTAQFRREFLQRTGMLPKHYLEQVKLRQAAADVANTSATMRDIARRYGYHDAFHFSRRFKALFGMSPTQYRQFLIPVPRDGLG